MTVILTLTENDITYVGYDSRWLGGFEITKATHNKLHTLFELGYNDNFVIGTAGKLRLSQIIYNGDFTDPPKNTNFDDKLEYLYKVFIPELKLLLGANDEVTKDNNFDGDVIIIWGNKVFQIYCDYSLISPTLPYFGIGYYEIGYGVLSALNEHTDLKPEEKLLYALSETSKHFASCSPPYIIYRSDRGKVIGSNETDA